jgi:hypothetical protein
MRAIKKNDEEGSKTVTIDQDECVECGVCLRSGVCKTDAIYWPKLEWPRAIRQAFSAVLIGYNILDEVGIHGYVVTSGEAGVGGGRGTSEMKTNDVTGRYGNGEVGMGVEFGRPCVGFHFRDVEKISTALVKHGVEFELQNPLTMLLDLETGEIKYDEVRNEKAMSAILEFNIKQEQAVEVIKTLQEKSRELDTVITVDIINKCKEATIPVLPMLEDAGIDIRINGKTNVGLGRPLIP